MKFCKNEKRSQENKLYILAEFSVATQEQKVHEIRYQARNWLRHSFFGAIKKSNIELFYQRV
jgi:hypothetical protein